MRLSPRPAQPVNQLLAALPSEEYERLLPHLEPVPFSLGQVVYESGAFQLLLLKYTQALITQIAQTAVCNRLHPVEKRLCRWLLMTQDRAQSGTLQMTHEFIANMLGIQREAVSMAAHRLQGQGIVSYVRGRITILGRARLEECACEC